LSGNIAENEQLHDISRPELPENAKDFEIDLEAGFGSAKVAKHTLESSSKE
jgi:hypothetical protein